MEVERNREQRRQAQSALRLVRLRARCNRPGLLPYQPFRTEAVEQAAAVRLRPPPTATPTLENDDTKLTSTQPPYTQNNRKPARPSTSSRSRGFGTAVVRPGSAPLAGAAARRRRLISSSSRTTTVWQQAASYTHPKQQRASTAAADVGRPHPPQHSVGVQIIPQCAPPPPPLQLTSHGTRQQRQRRYKEEGRRFEDPTWVSAITDINHGVLLHAFQQRTEWRALMQRDRVYQETQQRIRQQKREILKQIAGMWEKHDTFERAMAMKRALLERKCDILLSKSQALELSLAESAQRDAELASGKIKGWANARARVLGNGVFSFKFTPSSSLPKPAATSGPTLGRHGGIFWDKVKKNVRAIRVLTELSALAAETGGGGSREDGEADANQQSATVADEKNPSADGVATVSLTDPSSSPPSSSVSFSEYQRLFPPPKVSTIEVADDMLAFDRPQPPLTTDDGGVSDLETCGTSRDDPLYRVVYRSKLCWVGRPNKNLKEAWSKKLFEWVTLFSTRNTRRGITGVVSSKKKGEERLRIVFILVRAQTCLRACQALVATTTSTARKASVVPTNGKGFVCTSRSVATLTC